MEQLKERNNNDHIMLNDHDDTDDSVCDLHIDDTENNVQDTNDEINKSKTVSMTSTPKPRQKRKANHLQDNYNLAEEENIPPPKKRNTNSRRCKR
jgi:hypothetical protein